MVWDLGLGGWHWQKIYHTSDACNTTYGDREADVGSKFIMHSMHVIPSLVQEDVIYSMLKKMMAFSLFLKKKNKKTTKKVAQSY